MLTKTTPDHESNVELSGNVDVERNKRNYVIKCLHKHCVSVHKQEIPVYE